MKQLVNMLLRAPGVCRSLAYRINGRRELDRRCWGHRNQQQEQRVGEKEEIPRQTAAVRREEASGVLVRRRQPPQGPLPEKAY